MSEVERPVIRSYRLRGDRATAAQAQAYQRLWPAYGLDPRGTIDAREIFPTSTARIMEIGSGMG